MGSFSDVVLEQPADSGDDNYYYVNTMNDAHRVFAEELTSTIQVIAYDAEIQIDFNPGGVAFYCLNGEENGDVRPHGHTDPWESSD